MKTHTIDRSAWHYRFISRFREIGYHTRPYDICEYRQWFMTAIMRMLLVYAAITVFLALPVTLTGTWLAAGIAVGYISVQTLPDVLAMYWLIVLVLVAMVGLSYITHVYGQWQRKRRAARGNVEPVESKPGIVTLMYRSAKEKYCVRVEFK